MNLDLPFNEYTYIAFDTETSGAYPLGHDIVELGAIKWKNGVEIGRLQMLFKPRKPMSDFIIGIHGITNKMVEFAPVIETHIHEIHDFFKGSVVLAHHAPFDLGFLAWEFEKAKLPLLEEPALCTSLLSRKLIHGVENHRLQTLVKYLGLDGGQAHRAYDDAKACLQVALECIKKMPEGVTLADLIKTQGKKLNWKDFSLLALTSEAVLNLIQAIKQGTDADIVYQGGSNKGKTRRVTPIGIVRNPDGDYLQARCHEEQQDKKYYLQKISEAGLVF